MLVKDKLQKSIEDAVYNAMKSAMTEMMNATTGCVNEDGKVIKEFKSDEIVETFAKEAKSCASDIATAIDDYIKSATITLNAGTLMTPMPTLISPAGPVTGVITLAAPTVLSNSIT
jgi:hypothetical protein